MSNYFTMKKHLLPLVFSCCALLVACNTTQKLYEAKEYDQVIMKTAPKLCSGRITAESVNLAANAYHHANQADHERILALKATGQPDIWPEIYERYRSMKGRNEALDCLPYEIKKGINFTKLDLDEELSGAQNKAEAYLEAKINQSLQANGQDSGSTDRLIHELERVNPSNSRLNEFKLVSILRQSGDVLAGCTPKRGIHLPMGVEQAVMSFDANETASFPVRIHYRKRPRVRYGAIMDIVIKRCETSSDRDESVSFKESNGNQTVTVTDHNLSKTGTIKATLKVYDPRSGELLVSIPLEANSKFAHSHTTIEGPREACSAQTLERLNQQAVPFPTDESILIDAAKELNNMVAKLIANK